MNTEIYSVNLYLHCEYGKIRTRKNSVFRHFSHSMMKHLYIYSMNVTQSNRYGTSYVCFFQDVLILFSLMHCYIRKADEFTLDKNKLFKIRFYLCFNYILNLCKNHIKINISINNLLATILTVRKLEENITENNEKIS